MAVLTASKQRPVRLPAYGLSTDKVKLAGYTNFGAGNLTHEVYHGSIMVSDVSDTDGYFRACPLSSSVNLAAGDIFGGIAMERKSVTASDLADGAKECLVARDGVWAFAKGSIAITDIGAAAYASDDDTITTTSTNNLWVGYIEDVDDTYVWVAIADAFKRANSPT